MSEIKLKCCLCGKMSPASSFCFDSFGRYLPLNQYRCPQCKRYFEEVPKHYPGHLINGRFREVKKKRTLCDFMDIKHNKKQC